MTPEILFSIIAGVTVILITIFISKYNNLSRQRNQIENSISSLDAVFIKRADLIPNLVDVVKQYMNFEETTLEKITSLRTANSKSSEALEKDGNQAIKNLLVQVENYPELKANTQFTNLQYSWNEVEEQIMAGRRYISSSITIYNNSIAIFPGNIVARIFGFRHYEWQYASENEKASISAKALFN